jgi:hypothetical protein
MTPSYKYSRKVPTVIRIDWVTVCVRVYVKLGCLPDLDVVDVA